MRSIWPMVSWLFLALSFVTYSVSNVIQVCATAQRNGKRTKQKEKATEEEKNRLLQDTNNTNAEATRYVKNIITGQVAL